MGYRYFTNGWVDAMISSRVAAALNRGKNKEPLCKDDEPILRKGVEIISSLDAYLTDILVSSGAYAPLKEGKTKEANACISGAERYFGLDEVMKRLGVDFGEYHEKVQLYLRCLNGLLNPSQGSRVGVEEMSEAERFFATYSAAC